MLYTREAAQSDGVPEIRASKVTGAESAIHFSRLSRAFSARLGSDRSLAAASCFDIAPLALMMFAASCRELQASGPCSPEASCYEVLD